MLDLFIDFSLFPHHFIQAKDLLLIPFGMVFLNFKIRMTEESRRIGVQSDRFIKDSCVTKLVPSRCISGSGFCYSFSKCG